LKFKIKAILIGIGLQHKSIEDLEKELQLPPNQMLAMFNKIVKKLIALLEEISINQMNKMLFSNNNGSLVLDKKMEPLKQSLEEELNEASKKIKKDEMQHKKELLSGFDLKQYEIKGSENEWANALKIPAPSSYVTVKRYYLLSHVCLV
jgi:N-acetyltransferase 10